MTDVQLPLDKVLNKYPQNAFSIADLFCRRDCYGQYDKLVDKGMVDCDYGLSDRGAPELAVVDVVGG
ncbi:hypothetical protein PED39_04715 [Methanomassiliicoccales archaeon LGM-RCC1]|nr:hypothetical protein PED39_04715 [Methanomassiliicoccales archaeon LGM-RCC1]